MIGHKFDQLQELSNLVRRKQAQAMLDLFKADCGRAAVTLKEMRAWASTQQENELRSRVQGLVSAHMTTDADQAGLNRAALKNHSPSIATTLAKSLTLLLIRWTTWLLVEAPQHKRGHKDLEGHGAV